MTAGPYQLLPPLTDDELLALRDSIEQHGVLVPIIIDENGATLDGHHRKLIADSIGVECPQEVRSGLSETEKRTLAYGLNVNRRQMDTATKRTLVADSLRSDPELSDRQHAARVGVDHKTVATARGSLERRGEIPHVVERTDAIGRKVGAKPAATTSPDASSAPGDRTGSIGSTPAAPGATSPGQTIEPSADDADGSPGQPTAADLEGPDKGVGDSGSSPVEEPESPADLVERACRARTRTHDLIGKVDAAALVGALDLDGLVSWDLTVAAMQNWLDTYTAARIPQPLEIVR